jgi:simple sugar transport system ATP-binding protein
MKDPEAPEPQVALRLRGITKRFGPLLANDAISLTVAPGEIVGLLGENGAGKTTLMNILFGHYVADEGTIEVSGKPLVPGSPHAAIAAGIGMVHQHFTLADNLTVLDNIVLGTESLWSLSSDRKGARARIASLGEAYGLAVKPDATVSSLSVGERQRVEILKALYRDANILILDEPTAVLTPQESESLFATLKRFTAGGLSVIFISHKLGEILAVCHRVAILRGGRLVAERDVASATRAELAELMVGRNVPQARAEPQEPGPPVLSMVAVGARRGDLVLRNVNLEIRSGETVGIAGVSGNGQSLLADVLAGVVTPERGTISLEGRTISPVTPRVMVAEGVARIPEDRHAEGLIGDMSVMENVISEAYRRPEFSRHGVIDWRAARAFAERIVADYEVKCPSADAPVRLLSGGNLQKLILGRVMAHTPRLVLANQPTRGLDVGAVSYVHGRILAARQAGAAVLLISEDLDELLALADRIAVMYRGSISPLMQRKDVRISELGLMMAGHGFEMEASSRAA